jgi:hypothetical protein
MKKIYATFTVLFIALLTVHSQNKSFSGIKRFSVSGFKPILERNEVKGYFMFGLLDKVNRKENLYQITILDNNLNETHSVELTKSKTFYLLETAYNGVDFCFSFIDYKKKTLEYLLYDKAGKSVGSYVVSGLSNSEVQGVAARAKMAGDAYSGGLVTVSGKGFVRYGIEKMKGYRMEMEMFDNTGKKVWTANSGVSKDSKSFESVAPFYSDSLVVASWLTTRPGMFSRQFESDITFHDANTGKLLFKTTSKNAKYGLMPQGVSYDPILKEYFIYGEYTKPKSIVSLGFYIQDLDNKGVVKNENFMTWTGDIFKATPGAIKAKMQKNTFVAVHKMVRTADGKFFAIGEQFKKKFDGTGLLLEMLGTVVSSLSQGVVYYDPNRAMFKIVIYNMMVYEFNKDLKIEDVCMFDKCKTNIPLPRGAGINGSSTLGYYLKAMGAFDYAYSSVSGDRETFNSAYINYDKKKKTGNKLVVGNISYSKEHKLVQDKVDFSSKATYHWLSPAKPGYVCIFEYFRKAKRLDVRLEKLNT